jgi:hypothetical protein
MRPVIEKIHDLTEERLVQWGNAIPDNLSAENFVGLDPFVIEALLNAKNAYAIAARDFHGFTTDELELGWDK